MQIVGVVNITEDSFSDGGRYLDPAAAIAHARRLRSDGADVIELGAASSHPDATAVSADEERRRLTPVLEALAGDGLAVSVDATQPETQRLALALGAAYLIDVRGFPDPGVYAALAASDCRLVVVHSIEGREIATRVHTDPATIWARIDGFFADRLAVLRAGGIAHERLVVDPGLGFFLGANPEPSLAVLGAVGRLRARFGAGAGLALAQVFPPRPHRPRHRRYRAGDPGRRAVRPRAPASTTSAPTTSGRSPMR